jgi:alkanesulfonate monooxygenase SsuD/methylene tetrahydromethanopterin reductase-like flavin-dependent oxidoreductase (luciferase family)
LKFHWFHLMPYPDLPDDFRERYPSVWVDLPAKEVFDPIVGHRAYHEYLDELEYVDELGFDSIGVNEHHQNAYGLNPSPNLMAATLARRTSNARLLVLGASVPLYNPPLRVAEEMAVVDVLSGGRLIAGLPVGSPMDAAFTYGANPVTLREKYREGVELILRAWQSDAPFAFNGKYTKLRYVNAWPRPIQQPHPPIWIPAGGSVETPEWCARNDFLFAYLSFFGYLRAGEHMKRYWDAVDRVGADHNPHRAAYAQFICVADTDEEAERLYSEPARYFFNRSLHVHPRWFQAPGYTSIESTIKGMRDSMKAAVEQRPPDLSWKDIVEKRYVVAGSPDTVVQQLEELADSLNVAHLVVQQHLGNMSRETTLYNARMFAEKVMPRLRAKFSDWEDRWFPNDPLPNPAMRATSAVEA